MISQLHRLLLELIPGGAKKDLSAAQAKAPLGKVRPRDAAGRARRRVCVELVADLERIYDRKKAANRELNALLAATGSTLAQALGQSSSREWTVPMRARRRVLVAGGISDQHG